MKAGTAQKMVLNMISTSLMIKSGHVWDNKMIDMKASNQKLRARAIRILQEIGGLSEEKAIKALKSGMSLREILSGFSGFKTQ